MSKKPLPRIITGAVITTIALAAFLTFTRGEAPATDTASASLPSVSGTDKPVVEGPTPTPSSSASADTAEREAKNKKKATTTTVKAPVSRPTTTAPKPRPSKPPTQSPSPSPSPTPTRDCGLFVLLGCK